MRVKLPPSFRRYRASRNNSGAVRRYYYSAAMRIPAVLVLTLLLCLAGPPPVFGCVCLSYPQPFCARDLDALALTGSVVFLGTVGSREPESYEALHQQVLELMPEEYRQSFSSQQAGQETEPSEEANRAYLEAWKRAALELYADRLQQVQLDAFRNAETERQLEDAIDLAHLSRRVRFELLESLVGESAESVEVAAFSGRDCGFAFEKGETYLVEAWRDEDGRLHARACSSRVMHIDDAKEDLAVLRAWKRGERRKPLIYGRLFDWTEHQGLRLESPPAAAVPLRLVGGDEPIGVLTDESGRFRVGDLTRQAYQLKLELPGWRFVAESGGQMEIDLGQRGCAELLLRIEKAEEQIRTQFEQRGRRRELPLLLPGAFCTDRTVRAPRRVAGAALQI